MTHKVRIFRHDSAGEEWLVFQEITTCNVIAELANGRPELRPKVTAGIVGESSALGALRTERRTPITLWR